MSARRQRMVQAARGLGHNWVGAEHLMLALLDPDDMSPPAIAVRECGISQAAYAEAVAALPEGYTVRPAVPGALEHSRSLNAIEAKAEGLAMAMGSEVTRAEHLMLAMLWERTRPPIAIQILQTHFGVTRRRIVEGLTALGVEIPKVPLPPDLEWNAPRLVSPVVFKELQAQWTRDGIRYGCKVEGDQILVFTARVTAAY